MKRNIFISYVNAQQDFEEKMLEFSHFKRAKYYWISVNTKHIYEYIKIHIFHNN